MTRSRDIRVSQNLKIRSRNLGHAPFSQCLHFFVSYPLPSIRMNNFEVCHFSLSEILHGSKNSISRSRDLGQALIDHFFVFCGIVCLKLNPHAKREACFFSLSRDIIEVPKFEK